ncbi:MAG: serine/threonine protein phosphatase [Pedosphaera sp. Tous-C6FEB]|nr:MAG: serine/threonine protein phosphatase [Pedosphaera sp. Tous-C6FEB]
MPKVAKPGRAPRIGANTAKYDAHHTVLKQTYGALADLRAELADSKEKITERTNLLNLFATCADSQRSWLLLEDYFEKLNLSRKDFGANEWWPRMAEARSKARLEELAILFLRAGRSLPQELQPHANYSRFAEIEQAEQEGRLVQELEHWLFPPAPVHLDSPRAGLRIICKPVPAGADAALHQLRIAFHLFRPRTGEKEKNLEDLIDLNTRAAHEQELFPPMDWEFIQWVVENYRHREDRESPFLLHGLELLQWIARWGHHGRLLMECGTKPVVYHGQVAELTPHLQNGDQELAFTQRIKLSNGEIRPLSEAIWFGGQPPLAFVDDTFYLLRNAPPGTLLESIARTPTLPVRKLSHRFLTNLRRAHFDNGVDWDQLCTAHPALPQFTFELVDEVIRIRLLARSERDQSIWHWNGHEWVPDEPGRVRNGKPEILDDLRLEPAIDWLRRLNCFTPEPGLWVGDAAENFFNILSTNWATRPADAEFLGNAAFQRLFLTPRKLKPNLIVKGSGIDWFSVSAEWESEGMKLTKADLQRLASATGRFVKLPDSGWVELDTKAVQNAHEALADLGLEGLSPIAQQVPIEQAAHLDEKGLEKFGDSEHAKVLRKRLANFEGIAPTNLPAGLNAELRPYQKEGFDFLCHLTSLRLGGILADDMGLGKTLQTLSWLAWHKARNGSTHKPALVICPASVLHNWRREAEKFVPHLKVLVLQSGAGRHTMRKLIPQHDIIVTNYALLRRDLEELNKFDFGVLVLDEAQFIKNPTAQVTQSVKQLKADHRVALTGTPLENRLLDLWSICDFIQPGYLGTQEHFNETYDPKSGAETEEAISLQRIARRRLSAKLRPLLLRRLKKQVAKDLPDRIEQRRDCELGEEHRKLYLAELRRSREQVMQAVKEKGLAKSKMHVLAALTRLRQICCHPQLVGSDVASGKTETLFELLDTLVAEGQKVLVFSQFVQMLKILETDCAKRGIPTHLLTGETKQRQEVVNAFQADEHGGVFLLSLRAAGTGLNLTNASYVVLYDPWWNPAVEAQAIDRSHRIGQTRTVNAYRLIAPGTVEEKIWDLQQRKAQTIQDVLGEEGFARSLSQTDLEYLFSEE